MGGYAAESSGILSESGGRILDFSLRRELGSAYDRLALSAVFTVGGQEYPYQLESERLYSGVRGDFAQTVTRNLTGWSGITKTSNGSQSVHWTLGGEATVASTSSSASIVRPYPLSDGYVGNIGGTPNPVVATETVFLDMLSNATSSGVQSNLTRLDFQYDNGIPPIVGSDFVLVVECGAGEDGFVDSTMAGNFLAAGQSFPAVFHSRAEAVPGTKLVQWFGSDLVEGMDVGSWNSVFDPPTMCVDGFWEKMKKGVKVTAQCMGTVSMWAIGGLGCLGTTVGGAALGGVTSVASLGTATPAGLAAAGGGVVACSGLVAGADYVVGKIWEH
ncbi:MAG: hypothetical protein AB1793_09350 [Candidatus Thermoplasmatota archaeon]